MTGSIKSVCIHRTFAAPAADVFRAWTDQEQVKRWLAPGVMKVTRVEIDPVEGGAYCLLMKDPTGAQAEVEGKIRTLAANKQLDIEWQWKGSAQPGLLSVEFIPLNDSETELRLNHGDFPSMDETQNHENGWSICLDKLAKAIND